MNPFSFAVPMDRGGREGDGSWLTPEAFQVLAIGFVVAGALIVLLTEPLSALFPGGWGEHKEAPMIGILLVGLTIGAYAYAQRNLAVGVLVLAGGLSLCISLALVWGLGPGGVSLLLLPVVLTALLTNRTISLLFAGGTILLVLLLLLTNQAIPRVEGYAAILLIGATWLLAAFVERSVVSVMESLQLSFRAAMHEREEARDERLKVRQLNDDLAQAYVQLRRLNEMLLASQLEADAARQAKEQFVARVSHELRTPINMVIGFSEMIIQAPETYGSELPRALLSDIGVIHRNSQHLSQLINDVLVLSQANAGQMSLARNWVMIGDIVDEARHAIEPLFRTKGLALTVCVPPEPLPVYCDKLRVRQVLLNLLSNAGRHTTAGGATIKVETTQRTVVVAVQDTGPGIAPEDQQRVFEPFQQLDEPGGERSSGSGLGLAISQSLVRMHGGSMWLESEPGKGATFFFSLPCAPVDPTQFRVVLPENPYSTYVEGERRPLPVPPAPRARLLVLEGETNIGPQLGTLLPECEAVVVNDAQSLAEEVRRYPPTAVIINDAGAMDDVQFSRRLLELPERTPIFSCYVPGYREAITELNIADYLVKPVTRSQLLEVVGRVAQPHSAILCVEDNKEVARLVRRQLASAGRGYRVLEANHGAGALEMLRTRRPDMVLLDLGLPDQDGYEILRQKNSDPGLEQIPVVVMSARDPQGGPIVAGRLRVELVGGLSLRDIAECAVALSGAFGGPLSDASRDLRT